jgi:hypothetical protein
MNIKLREQQTKLMNELIWWKLSMQLRSVLSGSMRLSDLKDGTVTFFVNGLPS